MGVILFSVGAFFVAYLGPVRYTGSDPQGTLLTSQAILDHHTVRLDAYAGMSYVPATTWMDKGERLRHIRGHCYHFSPLGTSIYILPFVFFARVAGEDMLSPKSDGALQNLLSAMTVGLAFLLVYLISAQYLPHIPSLSITTAFVLGSPLISTMGTALWNTNFAVLFILSALVMLVNSERNAAAMNPYLLGFLLFSAYLCRPTALLFAVGVCVYVLVIKRGEFFKLAATFVGLMLVLILHSLKEYGQVLPDYYLLTRVPGVTRFFLIGFGAVLAMTLGIFLGWKHWRVRIGGLLLVGFAILIWFLVRQRFLAGSLVSAELLWRMIRGMYGNLFSPSRGLVVFSPYLILTWLGLPLAFARVRRKPLFWLTIGWLMIHLVVISKPFRWWGGHCFGSRFFTEAFPGVILLTLIILDSEPLRQWRHRWAVAVFMVLLCGASIGINTFQGLYNNDTTRWNAFPNIDIYQNYLWSWRYPQFLANKRSLDSRWIDHNLRALGSYEFGDPIAPRSNIMFFHGWWATESDEQGAPFRFSDGDASIWFNLASDERYQADLVLTVEAGAFCREYVHVEVNGQDIGSMMILGLRRHAYYLPLPWHLLRPRGKNCISFICEDRPRAYLTNRGRYQCPAGFRLWRMRLRGRNVESVNLESVNLRAEERVFRVQMTEEGCRRDSSLLGVAQNDSDGAQTDMACVILRKRSDRRIWERGGGEKSQILDVASATPPVFAEASPWQARLRLTTP